MASNDLTALITVAGHEGHAADQQNGAWNGPRAPLVVSPSSGHLGPGSRVLGRLSKLPVGVVSMPPDDAGHVPARLLILLV